MISFFCRPEETSVFALPNKSRNTTKTKLNVAFIVKVLGENFPTLLTDFRIPPSIISFSNNMLVFLADKVQPKTI